MSWKHSLLNLKYCSHIHIQVSSWGSCQKLKLSVENWRIRNIRYPALFPSSHGLSLTPYSPIFPNKLPEVKTWMGAAEVGEREASAEPFVAATLVVLHSLKLVWLPLHAYLLKWPSKPKTILLVKYPFAALPNSPHLCAPGKLTVGKTHLAQITNCLGWLLIFPVCVSCLLQPQWGPQHTFWRNWVAFFSITHRSQHSSMYTGRVPCAFAHGLHDSIIWKAFWVEYLLFIEKQELQLDKNAKALRYIQFPSHCFPTSRVPCLQIERTCSLLNQNAPQCISLFIISLLTGGALSQLYLSKHQLTLQSQIQMLSQPWNLPRQNSLAHSWTLMAPCVYLFHAIDWWAGIT